MFSGLSRMAKSMMVLFISTLLLAMILITIATFTYDNNVFDKQVVATLNILIALIFGFIQILPVVRDFFHTKQVTDEQLTNALTELAQAKILLDNNDYIRARDSASQVLEILPKKAEAYYIRGKANTELGQYASALEDYNQVIDLTPGEPFVYSSRAFLYKEIGELSDAIEDWKTGIKIAPEISSQFFQLGHCYFLIGKYEEARNTFNEVINHSSTSDNEKRMAKEFNQRIANILETSEI